MPQFLVKTTSSSSSDYNISAYRFEIKDGILYYFDDEGDLIVVIREWVSFFQVSDDDDDDPIPTSPDDFYEQITKEGMS